MFSVVRVKVMSAQAFKLNNTKRSSFKTRVRLRGLLQEDTHPSAEIVKMKSEQRKMSVSGEGGSFLFFPSGSLTAGSYEVAPTYLTSPRCARTSSATQASSLFRECIRAHLQCCMPMNPFSWSTYTSCNIQIMFHSATARGKHLPLFVLHSSFSLLFPTTHTNTFLL